MPDFILIMHDDIVTTLSPEAWAPYFAELRGKRAFIGGSAMGAGTAYRKQGTPGAASPHLTGYIRVKAKTLTAAEKLLPGNPVFDCGGTVEIRELPITDTE